MTGLGKLWAGKVFGTNTGNVFVELTGEGPEISGLMRFLDDRFGPVVYELQGEFDDSLEVTGTPRSAPEGVELGDITLSASLTSEGWLRGKWESTLETGGTFTLFPHGASQSAQSTPQEDLAEQFYFQTVEVGSLTLFADQIRALISKMAIDFDDSSRVIATYNDGGPDVTRFADDFIKRFKEIPKLKRLRLFIQEPDTQDVNKSVTIDVSADGPNQVVVQGVRESWVVGKATALAATLRRNESSIVTNYKRFGLNINSLVLLSAVVLAPEITSLISRIVFIAAIGGLLGILYWVHRNFISNAEIVLATPTPSLWDKWKPSLVSWFVAVTASLTAALIFWNLTGNAA